MSCELKTFLILKYGTLDKLLHKWALSDEDFLSLDEKQILIDHCDGRFCVTNLKSLKDMRDRNLRVLHGVYQ